MIPRMIVADADQSAPSALAVVLLVVAVAALTLLASQLRGWLHSRTAANGTATRGSDRATRPGIVTGFLPRSGAKDGGR